MPFNITAWNDATESESTATELVAFLGANEPEAYSVDELLDEFVADDLATEPVAAYYRAVLETLVYADELEKRRDSDDSARSYYHIAPTEASPNREPSVSDQLGTVDPGENLPARPPERSSTSEDEAPFFVRWYRWYRNRT